MTTVLLYEHLPAVLRQAINIGQGRTTCPTCAGGKSREVSLSIRHSQDGLISMKCFRASCGWFGLTMPDGNLKFQTKPVKLASFYDDDTLTLRDSPMLEYLQDTYGIKEDSALSHGWLQSASLTTLVMPVLSPYGLERGVATRTFRDPKRCYTYKATAQPWLDWWYTDSKAPIVLVEDCISACRLHGLGYTAVSLLGTNLNTEQAKEIDKQASSQVYLALDRDAFVKSLKLRDKHKHILDMSPICLDEDIKNIASDDAIRKLFD